MTAPQSPAARSSSCICPFPKLPARAMPAQSREIASAVERTPEVPLTFWLLSSVSPFRNSRKIVHTCSITFLSGSLAFRSMPPDNCSTLVFTISISVSRSFGDGSTTMLKRLFKAADISFTPLSLVFAVAIMENPFFAGISRFSSGTEILFSDNMEISASCTSDASLEISSTLAIVPVSIARNTGLFNIAFSDGPCASSIA